MKPDAGDETPTIGGEVKQWLNVLTQVHEDEVLYDVLKEINGSSFKACRMINNFYKNNNGRYCEIVEAIENSNII